MGEVKDLLDDLRKEFDEKYMSKDAFKDFLERIEKLEKDYVDLDNLTQKHDKDIESTSDLAKKNETDIASTSDMAKKNEADIEELRKLLAALQSSLANKLDCDLFDDEISMLKNLINSMGSGEPIVAAPTGPSISTKDLNRIKELVEKIPGLEDILEKIQKDLKQMNLGEIREKIKELFEVKAEKSDLQKTDVEVQRIADELARLQAESKALKKLLENSQGGDGLSGDVIIEINTRIDKLEVIVFTNVKDIQELRKMAPT